MAPRTRPIGSRAAQPVMSSSSSKSVTVSSSAAQPALFTNQDIRHCLMKHSNIQVPAHETCFATLQDVGQWLDQLSERDQRLLCVCLAREAPLVLEREDSRCKRAEIQQLLSSWGIQQKASRRKLGAKEVEHILCSKVVEAASRLQRFGTRCSDARAHNCSLRRYAFID